MSPRLTKPLVLAAAVVALAGLSMTRFVRAQAAGTAAGAPAANTPAPSKLAVINIVQLFDKLDEKVAKDGELDTMKKTMTDSINTLKAEVEKIQKDLDSPTPTFKVGSPEYKKEQDDLLEKSMELQVKTQVYQKQLLMKLAITKADLYKKINDAVADYSQKNGIAMVFVADDPNVNDAQSPEALQALISLRKVVYADARFDITRAILEKMNNEFRLGSGR